MIEPLLCEWCGQSTGSATDRFESGRLVKHAGKMELWCASCLAEDGRGLPGSYRSKESVKRKKTRPKYGDGTS